jgi:LEA14-like dessication related protein
MKATVYSSGGGSIVKRLNGLAVFLVLLVLAGCASLKELVSIERPNATLTDVSLTSISFSQADLLAEITVENPNPVGIRMAGFAYTLEVEGSTLLSGDHSDRLEIESFGESIIELPVSVRFRDLFDISYAMVDKDEAGYRLGVTLRFDVPVLGAITVPLEREGRFPVIRLPDIRISSLRLKSISITGADLELDLGVSNRNAFGARISSLQYALEIHDQVWIDGRNDRGFDLPARGEGQLTIPFSLSFRAFGRTVRDLLLGDNDLDYSFEGAIVIQASLPLMHEAELPVSFSGTIPLSR